MADPVDEVVRFTSDLIRIDTSNRGAGDCAERPAAEYVAAQLAEDGLEPLLLESAPDRANVVVRLAGADRDRPGLLVHGHLDVVPAEPDDWTVHPFSGEVADGWVWGRGAIDMKGMVAMMLTVARRMAREGRRPARDVVLAFTADEEDSAAAGSDWLVREHADLFEGCAEGISESGAYTFHAAEGVRLYPVSAGERGTAWLELTAHGTAGHGSRANGDNAVGVLAEAVARIHAHRWPARLTPTVRAALREIGGALGVPTDPEAPGFDVDDAIGRLGAAGDLVASTVRNSANPTMLQAGYKVNVIPGSATARVDGRVLPGGDAEFEATLDRLCGDAVSWRYVHREVPLEASVDTPTFTAMRESLLAEDPGAHVVPVCLAGGTDAKQFSRLGITGYGFAPLRLPDGFDYSAAFHGVDERVPVDGLEFGVEVLDRFLATC
ncbi:M20/M25/M40 family metallo-hydrolase [Nocardioides sp. LHG3406-4]|uniref:M20/M25/M40 family metallo-hydrolase n=1 Tax=Nocardioides sp. LHG3406-4 TaxID=2804575 RepID=UPI003CFA1B06